MIDLTHVVPGSLFHIGLVVTSTWAVVISVIDVQPSSRECRVFDSDGHVWKKRVYDDFDGDCVL